MFEVSNHISMIMQPSRCLNIVIDRLLTPSIKDLEALFSHTDSWTFEKQIRSRERKWQPPDVCKLGGLVIFIQSLGRQTHWCTDTQLKYLNNVFSNIRNDRKWCFSFWKLKSWKFAFLLKSLHKYSEPRTKHRIIDCILIVFLRANRDSHSTNISNNLLVCIL
jgi:hypothetical protein